MSSNYKDLQQRLKDTSYTWLVTGAAGFIGSNLVDKLLSLQQRVIGLDNFETGYADNLNQALEGLKSSKDEEGLLRRKDDFTLIEGDIRDLKTCHRACDGVDYVLHQAALGSVPRSISDPIRTNSANIDGFLNMLSAARENGVKRFVYASSSSTYGDHPDLPKVEDNIGNPLSPSAVTKLVNELYAGAFSRTYGFNTIGLRYFNVFGKRQDPSGAYAAVIPKWINSILNNQPVYINGDGETSRDFCYVDNVVQINILASMSDNKAASNVYNVAVNERTSLSELYNLIRSKITERIEDITIPDPIYSDFRSGDIRHSQADITKAIKLLKYRPNYDLSKGLDRTLDWYCEQHNSSN